MKSGLTVFIMIETFGFSHVMVHYEGMIEKDFLMAPI